MCTFRFVCQSFLLILVRRTVPDYLSFYKVAAYFKVDIEDLKTVSKQRKISRARKMTCYLAVRKLAISCAEVARVLKISPSTVSKAVIKGQVAAGRNEIQKDILGI